MATMGDLSSANMSSSSSNKLPNVNEQSDEAALLINEQDDDETRKTKREARQKRTNQKVFREKFFDQCCFYIWKNQSTVHHETKRNETTNKDLVAFDDTPMKAMKNVRYINNSLMVVL